MKTWQLVLLVVIAIYATGFVGMFVYLRGAEMKWLLSLLWPLTALWMLIGNVQ